MDGRYKTAYVKSGSFWRLTDNKHLCSDIFFVVKFCMVYHSPENSKPFKFCTITLTKKHQKSISNFKICEPFTLTSVFSFNLVTLFKARYSVLTDY